MTEDIRYGSIEAPSEIRRPSISHQRPAESRFSVRQSAEGGVVPEEESVQ